MLRTVLRLLVLTLSTALFGCDDNPNGRPLPPSGLSYPSTAIFTVSQRITPVAPTVTGVVSNYSVSPAFPAGVVLDAWSGVISGVPTEPSPLASYTITASNEGGLTTANITITVNTAAPAISYGAPDYSLELDSIDAVLLDLGHADSVVALDRDGSRLLSVDVTGRWVLWDTQHAQNLAHGHLACGLDSRNCEQAAELARSSVARVIGVSCNPATFARDARTLVDAGFRLERVLPVDQFLWSPHIELVGVFSR